MGTVHPTYNLTKWVRKYPLSKWKKKFKDPAIWVRNLANSPQDLAITEQVRRHIWPDLDRHPKVPCDVFTWAWGEPSNPAITKIGGIPFLDREDKWPVDKKGNLMGFVGQINFQDSRDLVTKLPGDVLLFFSKLYVSDYDKSVSLNFDEDPSSFHCRWMKTTDVRSLRTDIPKSGYHLSPLHGVIYRTFDVPTLDWEATDEDDRDPIYEAAIPPAIWSATKIGGVPHWEQGQDSAERGKRTPFLCQIRSENDGVMSQTDPYVNHPKKLTNSEANGNRRLTIYDVGSAYMFLVKGKIDLCAQGG